MLTIRFGFHSGLCSRLRMVSFAVVWLLCTTASNAEAGPPSFGFESFSLPADLHPKCAVTGDFNGDGKVDIVTPVQPLRLPQATQQIVVLLGSNDGSFNQQV